LVIAAIPIGPPIVFGRATENFTKLIVASTRKRARSTACALHFGVAADSHRAYVLDMDAPSVDHGNHAIDRHESTIEIAQCPAQLGSGEIEWPGRETYVNVAYAEANRARRGTEREV
jgi:hypothetical protein